MIYINYVCTLYSTCASCQTVHRPTWLCAFVSKPFVLYNCFFFWTKHGIVTHEKWVVSLIDIHICSCDIIMLICTVAWPCVSWVVVHDQVHVNHLSRSGLESAGFSNHTSNQTDCIDIALFVSGCVKSLRLRLRSEKWSPKQHQNINNINNLLMEAKYELLMMFVTWLMIL